MGTRAIVTFHPDVECDVCGRRLLRGEQPDVFIGGGQRRMVCELCSPRAAHEGWLREADGHLGSPRASRPQRGRSLLGRLRQTRAEQTPWSPAEGASEEPQERLVVESEGEPGSAPLRAAASRVTPNPDELTLERALEVFNGSQQPRRVAGVARSLGVPVVRAAPVADSHSLISIVVAWELCWYRYQVDLGDEAAGVQLTGQGMELEELPEEDRVGNAVVDERGELSLLLDV